MNSINTNVGAMIALKNLNSVNTDLNKVQQKISTGLNVSGAKDDASVFAVAQGIRANIKAYDSVGQSLSSAKGILSVATTAATSVSDLMQDVKSKLVLLTDDSLTDDQRTIYTGDLKQMVDTMRNYLERATQNGTNILAPLDATGASATPDDPFDGSGPADIKVSQDVTGRSLTVRANNLMGDTTGATDTGWLGFARIVYQTADDTATASSMTVSTPSPGSLTARTTITGDQARAALGNYATASANPVFNDAWDNFSKEVNSALGNLGADARNVDAQIEFNKSLQDTATEALGGLVDADLAKESAKLTALQTKQQLAMQSLSIANQGPSSLMSLFRS